jgi:hypothetical protein
MRWRNKEFFAKIAQTKKENFSIKRASVFGLAAGAVGGNT